MANIFHEEDPRLVFPLESRMRFENVSLLEGCYIECPPAWLVYNLRYSYHRMYYIIDGEAYYQKEGGPKVPLKKNHLYIFPSQSIRYQIRHDPQHPLHVTWCHFEIVPDIVNDLIEIDASGDADLQQMIDMWNRIVHLEKPGNEMYHILSMILYHLERQNKFSYADLYFEGLEQYILDHLSGDLSVNALAERYGYERSYFSRKFQEIYHISPKEYLRAVRMNRAANMLVFGFSIDQICSAIGYSDKKVFSRAFKTYFNMSPTEYIKYHKMQL